MYRFKTNLMETTKNKIYFVSPWKDELNDLDYTKTIAVTHKIENDGRKDTKKRSGSQVRKQVRQKKAKEDSERASRIFRQLFGLKEGMEEDIVSVHDELKWREKEANERYNFHTNEAEKYQYGTPERKFHEKEATKWEDNSARHSNARHWLEKAFSERNLKEAYHTRDAQIKKRFWNVLELSESAINDVVKDLKMYRQEHHDSFNELANSRKKDQETKDQMDHHIYHINKIDGILDDLHQYLKYRV